MTDHSNSDQKTTPRHSQNQDSSPLGRAWGWSEANENDDNSQTLSSGSAAGDARRNQQGQSNGLGSATTDAGTSSATMRDFEGRHDDTDIAKVGDNIGVTGGR